MSESITCPKCGMVSHHPIDIREQYCGNCHMFHADIKAKADGWRNADHREQTVNAMHKLADDIRALVQKITTHECSGVTVSSLPPKWPNHIALDRCSFRRKPLALRYGDAEGHGIGYEWLGVRLEIGKKE